MSREIKFRMWNEITKTMIDLRKITPLALNMNTDGLFIPSCGMPLMQFTGRCDKNNIPIYEGDILTCSPIKSKKKEYKPIFQVVYEEYDTAFSAFDIKAKCWVKLNALKFKVIGNVYENPELLGVA